MSDLVVIEKSSVMTVFAVDAGLDPILAKIAAEARSVVADAKTAKGRDAIRSIAYKVAQSKTYLDGLGKDLVAEMKEMPKKVDEHRRLAREFLENLQAEVRKPLTDWEAEQARIEAEKEAEAEVRALATKLEADHEIGLLLNAEFDRQALAKREAVAQATRDEQARIEREATERATREAEDRIAREREEATQREIALRVQAERAEQDRIAAVAEAARSAAKAEQDKKDAETRAALELKLADERAERERLAGIEAERRRVAALEATERAEQAKRDADKAHKTAVNNKAATALIEHAGLSGEHARAVVIALVKGLIPNTRLTY